MKNVAIVLSAGKGIRMGGEVPKQYLEVLGKPVIYYTLMAFEHSQIDEIILVISEEYRDYVVQDIIKKYGFHKIKDIIYGGKERFHSVYNALKSIDMAENVLIHDAARPLIVPEQINMLLEKLKEYNACAAGMPVKDTIKRTDHNDNVVETPERSRLWQVQTPQAFRYDKIMNAYEQLINDKNDNVTDDAMVMELYGSDKVKLVRFGYENLKITTKEDLIFMKEILINRENIVLN